MRGGRISARGIGMALAWLAVLAVAPLFLFPTPEDAASLLVLPALLLIFAWLWRRVLPVTPLNAALLLMAVMIGVSLWATTDLGASLPKVSGLVYGLLIFFTTVFYAESRRGWVGALGIFCAAGTALAGLSLLGTRWFTTKFAALNPILQRLPLRLTGLSGAESGFHPNEVAGALLWVLPVMGAAVLALLCAGLPFKGLRLRWGWAILLSAAFALTSAVMILTQSRGGYIGLAFAGVFMAILALPRRARWVGWGLAVAAGGLGVWVIRQYGLQSLLDRVFTPVTIQSSAYASLNSRVDIWARAAAGLKDFSLTGMGMNRFRTIIQLLYPSFGMTYSYDLGHAHNELLQAGLDLGVAGLVAFISLYLTSFWMLIRLLYASEARRPYAMGIKWLVVGLSGGLIGHLIYGIADVIALGAKPGLLFWMLLGLIAGLYRQVVVQPQEVEP